MNRAMFSGVAGLKAHQTKMDVIGNNIANVNTYGYKSQRAVFSDVYYQTIKSASGGTTSRGGTNPSSVGYGSSLTAIQAQMSQSSLQNTGFGLDVAITGEGFLQVMDADGNTFYTKAGLLDYDSNGYLTDINGNFVLGSASADGKPGTQKIKLDNIGSVNASKPETKVDINGITYTLSTSNADKAGNVGVTFGVSKDLPAGLKAEAEISTSGAIAVRLNANEKFNSMTELNAAINSAITEANGGKQHAAGVFTLSSSKNVFGVDATAGGWTGKLTADKGILKTDATFFNGSMSVESFTLSKTPTGDANPNFTISYNDVDSKYTIKTTIEGVDYTKTFAAGDLRQGGTLQLDTAAGTTPAGNIKLKVDDLVKLNRELLGPSGTPAVPGVDQKGSCVPTVGGSLFGGGLTVLSSNITPAPTTSTEFTIKYNPGTSDYTISGTVDGKALTATFSKPAPGTLVLKDGASPANEVQFTTDNTKLAAALDAAAGTVAVPGTPKSCAGAYTAPSYFLGGMTIQGVSSNFSGSGDVNFAVTNVDAAAGTYTLTASVGGINYKGTVNLNGGTVKLELDPRPSDPKNEEFISLTAPSKATIISNLGLPTAATNADIFAAINGTETKETLKMIAASPAKNIALTGAEIIEGNFGKISGTIAGMETGVFGGGMTLIKTSTNFTGTGTITGDDFKSTYRAGPPAAWEITMNIGGTEYKTSVTKDTVASSLLMASSNGDSIEVSNPGFDDLTTYYHNQSGTIGEPSDGDEALALTDSKTLTVTPAVQSKDLGLGSTGFNLLGGTVGGAITLDQLSSIGIGSDGTVTVSHPDKGTVVAGRITLATFANPSGLQLEGSNYYSASANSGDPQLCDPGSGGSGGLKSSALEMSNVDLSAEFADMITTQRGFQANSRIITVSDTMLEELINLKR